MKGGTLQELKYKRFGHVTDTHVTLPSGLIVFHPPTFSLYGNSTNEADVIVRHVCVVRLRYITLPFSIVLHAFRDAIQRAGPKYGLSLK